MRSVADRTMRLGGLDRLRGLAVVLMVLDHLALAGGLGGPWRLTVTRAALPLFALVAGSLLRFERPRVGRCVGLFVGGLVASVLWALIGYGQADVLVWFGLVLFAVPLLGPVGSGLWWSLLAAAVIAPVTWPIGVGGGYQPATVTALVMVGQLVGRVNLAGWGERLPAALEGLGRRPAAIYLGHLCVLAVAVTV